MTEPGGKTYGSRRQRTARLDDAGGDCDTLGVAGRAQDAGMTTQLSCPWCEDEVAFEVDETLDEIVCSACATRMAFAPDPVATFELLYQPVAA
jgi:hypothetical protein